MNTIPSKAIWPASELATGLAVLVKSSNLVTGNFEISPPPQLNYSLDVESIDDWLRINAQNMSISIDHQIWNYEITQSILKYASPCVLLLRAEESFGFIFITKVSNKSAYLLTRDGTRHSVSISKLAGILLQGIFQTSENSRFAEFINSSSVSQVEKKTLIAKSYKNKQNQTRLNGLWTLETSMEVSIKKLAIKLGFHISLSVIFITYLIKNFLFLSSWKFLGKSIALGNVDFGWLLVWVGLLATSLPFAFLAQYKIGVFGAQLMSLFKQKVFSSVLKISADFRKMHGESGVISAVLEAETFEKLAFDGFTFTIIGLLEIFSLMAIVLFFEEVRYFCLIILGGLLIISFLAYLKYKNYKHLSKFRKFLAKYIFEHMKGIKTLKVQSSASEYKKNLDFQLVDYIKANKAFDLNRSLSSAFSTYGWLFVGAVSLLPLIFSEFRQADIIAVAIGIIYVANNDFSLINNGLSLLSQAFISLKHITPLFQGSQDSASRSPSNNYIDLKSFKNQKNKSIVAVRNLHFQYKDSLYKVFKECNFEVKEGEKILITGQSGGGKSTFAKILSGGLEAKEGRITLSNLDISAWNLEQWRNNVVYVPQFHDNHIFSQTLKFNLLMARNWPPSVEDQIEAMEVCRDIGLGPLLDKMPRSLEESVGEMGWRLSHGEKSRIFVVRGILQKPKLLILDESIAAVDVKTKRVVLECIEKYVQTCILISHK